MSDPVIFRVRSVDPGANVSKTTWVRATSRYRAKHYVEDRYARNVAQSIVPRTPPADAGIHDLTTDSDDPELRRYADLPSE